MRVRFGLPPGQPGAAHTMVIGMRLPAVLLFTAGLTHARSPPRNGRCRKSPPDFVTPTGSAWSRDGHLYIADGPARPVHQYTPGHGAALCGWRTARAPAGLALDDHGRFLICESGARRLIRLTGKTIPRNRRLGLRGPQTEFAERSRGAQGRQVFFPTRPSVPPSDTRELPFYGVFRVGGRGGVSVLARWDKRPNGLALSPDGRLLYVASSDERAIRVFDLDRQGNASGERVLITGIEGVPNGLCTDDQGRLVCRRPARSDLHARWQIHRSHRGSREACQPRLRRCRSSDALCRRAHFRLPRAHCGPRLTGPGRRAG